MNIVIAYDRLPNGEDPQNHIIRTILLYFRKKLGHTTQLNVRYVLNTTMEFEIPDIDEKEYKEFEGRIIKAVTNVAFIKIYKYTTSSGIANSTLDQMAFGRTVSFIQKSL